MRHYGQDKGGELALLLPSCAPLVTPARLNAADAAVQKAMFAPGLCPTSHCRRNNASTTFCVEDCEYHGLVSRSHRCRRVATGQQAGMVRGPDCSGPLTRSLAALPLRAGMAELRGYQEDSPIVMRPFDGPSGERL